MILGCTSDAGKSFLAMAVCRALANRGLKVAPFKAQNMSNNAAVTADGLEIGRAQYAQALAARAEPDVRMNPVLIKPLSDTRGAVILNGLPAPDVEAMPWMERPRRTWPVVEASLRSLLDDFDVVVIEGAGSPAEVNLRASDIVNMRVALAVQARSYLCSDIDRGGSLAHLLGTWHCLDPDEQRLLRGFILNKFRGDAALLGDATGWLEERTGVPTVAVVPWIHHQLPEEDRLVIRNADATTPADSKRVGIILYPFASNTDEFDALGAGVDIRVETVRANRPLRGYDAIVLPGSRNVTASVNWLRSVGLADQIRAAASSGVAVLGICGGLQILGAAINDPLRLEGGDIAGLNLLDVTTELAAAKVTKTFRRKLLPTGDEVLGYEIHHGMTSPTQASTAVPIFDGDTGWRQGSVVGVYAHGLLEDSQFRSWWLGTFGAASTAPEVDWSVSLDAEFDRVAAHVEASGLIDHMLAPTVRLGP